MEIYNCEQCESSVIEDRRCQECGHLHAKTYTEWLDNKIEELNTRGFTTEEDNLGMAGFSILDFEYEPEVEDD